MRTVVMHDLITWFNRTITDPKREKRQAVVSVTVSDDGAPVINKRQHDFHKTNAITISDRTGVYDRMECTRCGVTGKRFGLEHVKIDAKFRAKKFQVCRA